MLGLTSSLQVHVKWDYVSPEACLSHSDSTQTTLAAIICDVKCKAGQENTSDLTRHLVKNKIYLKLKSARYLRAMIPAATTANISMPAARAEDIEPSMDDKTISEASTTSLRTSGN